MVKLSFCMIVRNEEAFLEQCLQSVQRLVDEIIIVDTGSTDKTKAIAKQFTTKVFDFKWCDDFAAARNESLKYATGDWILVLDADEVIAKMDFSVLREAIKSTTICGYDLYHRNYTNDSAMTGWVSSKGDSYEESKIANGWWEAPLVRLFRNHPKIKFAERVHESVNSSLEEFGGASELRVPLHHYGKMNLEKLKLKDQFYEKLGEEKINEVQDYHSFYELGRQYVINKKCVEAVEALKKSIELKDDWFESWFMLGVCYILTEDLENAKMALEKAKQLNPDFAPAYVNLGIVHISKKEPVVALSCFQKAIQLAPEDAGSYFNLGLCYDELGKRKEAYAAFAKAIELNPTFKERIKLGSNQLNQ